ncbi:LysR family transcriptional regulator [Vibrio sp. MACH09]|uniref:LysR family transcriptional regulator n=1 Tax=Vibrio sp. MACH09 TaxID=3025122 RepID=UPI00295EABB4|nr:LysR family transcriptional regulator [Vibrio sp. MACH09]
MSIDKLARIDLNLLVCLKVLFEEENVTRAAEKLCLSQSAMSKSLAKLRVQFNDPLFTRTSHGLKPTSRAQAIKPKLNALVNQLSEIHGPDKFEPHLSNRRFNIALVESGYPLILPHFLPSLFVEAPNIKISTHIWDDSTFNKLKTGELDIGITGKDIQFSDAALTMHPPQGINEHVLYQDNQVCVVRKDHPVLQQEWDLPKYLSLRHVQVRCDGNEKWLLDFKLANLNLHRDVAITVPDFNSAASLCTYTDFVFTAPSHFSNLVAKHFDLVVLPLPLEFPPMAYTLFWHKDNQADPALDWLTKIIENRTLHLGQSTHQE